jgi:hypothetical protein
MARNMHIKEEKHRCGDARAWLVVEALLNIESVARSRCEARGFTRLIKTQNYHFDYDM